MPRRIHYLGFAIRALLGSCRRTEESSYRLDYRIVFEMTLSQDLDGFRIDVNKYGPLYNIDR
jgi:hypothetical protein